MSERIFVRVFRRDNDWFLLLLPDSSTPVELGPFPERESEMIARGLATSFREMERAALERAAQEAEQCAAAIRALE